jgi:ABC-2 type transport system permease protein
VLAIALSRSAFEPTATKLVYLVLTILGGMGFQSFTFLVGGSMSFKWINAGSQLGDTMRWFGTNLTQYPLSIYPAALRWLLTYIIPAALLNYFPAMYLVDRPRESIPITVLWSAPAALVVLGFLSLGLFRRAERSYQGSGG